MEYLCLFLRVFIWSQLSVCIVEDPKMSILKFFGWAVLTKYEKKTTSTGPTSSTAAKMAARGQSELQVRTLAKDHQVFGSVLDRDLCSKGSKGNGSSQRSDSYARSLWITISIIGCNKSFKRHCCYGCETRRNLPLLPGHLRYSTHGTQIVNSGSSSPVQG